MNEPFIYHNFEENDYCVHFYSIEYKDNGYYCVSSSPVINRIRTEETDYLNKSDYIYETIKLLIMKKVQSNDERAFKLIKKLENIENRIIKFEFKSTDSFRFEVDREEHGKIEKYSKRLCNWICNYLNDQR